MRHTVVNFFKGRRIKFIKFITIIFSLPKIVVRDTNYQNV